MRLIKIIAYKEQSGRIEELLANQPIEEKWVYEGEKGHTIIELLMEDENTSQVLSLFEQNEIYDHILIYPVEGTLPRKKEPEEEKKRFGFGSFISISKEELYEDVEKPVNLSLNFILLVVISSLVAGIGLLRDNMAILIGAMAIAPFLGPNMSLSLGTTLGDLNIIKKSLWTGLIATAITIVISLLWGLAVGDTWEVKRHVYARYDDIVLALACGFAGAITILTGRASTLVGVMVAAALLPMLMRSGLLLGGAHWIPAVNSFLIFCITIICLNIAGVITFFVSGIRPGRWYEKKDAGKKTWIALALWIIVLGLLAVSIAVLKKYFPASENLTP